MTPEQLAILFRSGDDEFLKFERIPEAERLHGSQFLCGLLKIAELTDAPAEEFNLKDAAHDIVFVAMPYEFCDMTRDEAVYLSRCGVHFSSEEKCLAMFC